MSLYLQAKHIIIIFDRVPSVSLEKCAATVSFLILVKSNQSVSFFIEFCYAVSVVPEMYLEVLKVSFNLSH
jgi:hypothetical protein